MRETEQCGAGHNPLFDVRLPLGSKHGVRPRDAEVLHPDLPGSLPALRAPSGERGRRGLLADAFRWALGPDCYRLPVFHRGANITLRVLRPRSKAALALVILPRQCSLASCSPSSPSSV
mmetsp:Transcript_9711/g.23313  ORF Transcript_9711/g.23313 Transcript_9711/m.23313 type:complete len:119 (+) Transcript_9711:154-510(+)